MTVIAGARSALLMAAGLVLLADPAPLAARQTGTVAGEVVEARTRRPLAGAQVFVPGTTLGVITNETGRFLLTDVPAGTVTIRARIIGYAVAEQSVPVPAGETVVARFELAESAISLAEIVVTGTAGATERRRIGNTIATINAENLVRDAPVASLEELVRGRAAGVHILPSSGQVGTGAAIRIRGMVSLSQTNSPLVYVDGVRIDNSKESDIFFGGQGMARLLDINPDDIERIEIIKGAAATTLYGTEASAGVIQVVTKQGRVGSPRWTAQVEHGLERIPNVLGGDSYDQFTGPGGFRARRAGEIIESGRHQSYRLSVGGGGDAVRYYASGGIQQLEGSVTPDRNHLLQVSMRTNLSAIPSEKLSLSFNSAYVNSRLRIPDGDNSGFGILTNISLAIPYTATEQRPWGEPFSPISANREIESYQRVHRFVGGLTAEYHPVPGLRNSVTLGVDMVNEETTKLFPYGFMGPVFGAGRKENLQRTVSNISVDYRTVWSTRPTALMSMESALGAQANFANNVRVFGVGEGFPAPGVSTVGAAARTSAWEARVREVNAGVFAQQMVGWLDRIFVTGGLRVDGNSAFGSEFRAQLYPKVSAAYTISDERFWPTSLVPTLKVRAAWGASGLAPAQFAADRTYLPISAVDGQAAVTPGNMGDPNLAPERSAELEVGFDAGLAEDRLGLVVTYYSQRTTDALVPTFPPPSQGFGLPQLKNIGQVRNHGLEASLRALWITRPNLRLETDLQLSTQHNRVTDMGEAGPINRHVINSMQVREGYPVAGFWARRLVGWDPELRRHLVTDTLEFVGSAMPKFFGSFTTDVTLFRNLSVRGMLDWATGHYHANATRRLRIQFRTGDEYLALVEKPTGARTPAADSLVDYVTRLGAGAIIEQADFLKVREISVAYALPDGWLGRLGLRRSSVRLAGRNLFTFTKYTGADPETSWDGTDNFNIGAEFFTVPPARRLLLAFRAEY